MKRALIALALLVLLCAPGRSADDALAILVREKIALALDRVGLAPADLAVRDVTMWRLNSKRLRQVGGMAGRFPLPRERDALRPALVDRALRSPMDAVSLGLELEAGIAPPELSGLIGGTLASEFAPPFPPVIDPERLGRGLPSWIDGVVSYMVQIEMIGSRLGPDRVGEPRMRGWMIEGVPSEELADGRAAFGVYAEFDAEPLLELAVAIARLALRDGSDGEGFPVLEEPLQFKAYGGTVILGTPGDDVYEEDAWLLIDPGGDDTYRNNAGGVVGMGGASVLIDLAGNDRYESKRPFTQGAAYRGVGILVDIAGDDVYHGGDFCQGAAVGGVGALFDFGGKDEMHAEQFAQAAAAFGIGVLRAAGPEDDRYLIDRYGQGFSRTAGLACLRDEGGSDSYRVAKRFESMYSQWTGGRKVHWSFAQGCGLGFYCRYEETRADGKKGLVIREMFPGGVGILVDDSGDDSYVGSMYAQGTAYFYGLGILVDRAGNDTYESTWYGQGAAPHFAAGILVDGAGDDVYRGINQVQGNGRDFSTAVFLDLAGDDIYEAEDRAQGCGDLSDGYGIFADLSGDDRYKATKKSARGWATNRDPARQPTSKRRYMDLGVFLDLAGSDTYEGPAGGADGTVWIDNRTGRGVGLDE